MEKSKAKAKVAKSPKESVTFKVTLTAGQLHRLKVAAAKADVGVSAYVRDLLDRTLPSVD